MSRVDPVVLSDDATRAYAVQGNINSLFKRHTDVNLSQAIATPLVQSSAPWPHDTPQLAPTKPPLQQVQNPQVDQPATRH
jgi:hypothetical protein